MKDNMKVVVNLSVFLVMGALSSTNAWEDNAANTDLEVFRAEGKTPMF